MAVTAHHRHAGLGQPQLRADDVHDALFDVAHPMQPDAELFAVAAERFHLRARNGVGDRLVDVDRWHVVVLGGDGQIWPVHRAPGQPQPVERLRTGHLVHEVQIDIDQVGLTCRAFTRAEGDDVVVPDFFCHGAWFVDGGHIWLSHNLGS